MDIGLEAGHDEVIGDAQLPGERLQLGSLASLTNQPQAGLWMRLQQRGEGVDGSVETLHRMESPDSEQVWT